MMIQIRQAYDQDSETLTKIAHLAKQYWGYPSEWMSMWNADLTITPSWIHAHQVYVAEYHASIIGFYALSGFGTKRELEHFWITPEFIGSGIGRRLFEHAKQMAVNDGCTYLRIVADPNATGFYVKMGAKHVGEVESIPAGRKLPVLVARLS